MRLRYIVAICAIFCLLFLLGATFAQTRDYASETIEMNTQIYFSFIGTDFIIYHLKGFGIGDGTSAADIEICVSADPQQMTLGNPDKCYTFDTDGDGAEVNPKWPTYINVSEEDPSTWNFPAGTVEPVYYVTVKAIDPTIPFGLNAIQIIDRNETNSVLPVGFHQEHHPYINYQDSANHAINPTLTTGLNASGYSYYDLNAGESINFTFEGTGLILYRHTSQTSQYDDLNVCIKDLTTTTETCSIYYTLNAEFWQHSILVARDLPLKQYSVRITGASNSAFNLDAVQILDHPDYLYTGLHDDTYLIRKLGAWENLEDKAALNHEYYQGQSEQDAVLFYFSGLAITIYRKTGPDLGDMEVCITGIGDGYDNGCEVISNVALFPYQQPVTITVPRDGFYRVLIKGVNGSLITFDAVRVLSD